MPRTSVPSELGVYSTRLLLIWRIRLILLINVAGGVLFGSKGLLIYRHPTTQFWVQVCGTSMAIITFFVLRQRWVVRYAWPLSVFVVAVCYIMTAIAGIVSPTGEYVTTAVLFVGAALTTATIVPWGVWGQVATVTVGAAAMTANVLRVEDSLHVFATDPVVAAFVAFALSIGAAREVNRYRIGHRRELLKRRRGEHANRHLSTRLEQRVLARTRELEQVNATLAREMAARIETQRRLADIIDHSNAMISLKDTAQRYVLVNRAFEAAFGRSRAELIGHTDDELFPGPLAGQLAGHDLEVLRGGRPVSVEQELDAGGAERSFVAVKFPLCDAAGTPYGVGTVATDITRVRQLQDELRQHQGELAHVLRLHTITELAAGLAHELNQPLCAITNYAQGGMQRLRNGLAQERDLAEAFERIAEEGLRAGQVIRGIRTLARRTTPSSEPIDLNALAHEAVRLLEARARQGGVALRLECDPALVPVPADGAQIEQVMLNLMLNAVEASEAVPGDEREVVVATRGGAGGVEVAVSDTGAGMSPGTADKLFTPFFTTKDSGLGLGLAISRSILELHGGRLWATPNDPRGMSFRFWLPHDDGASGGDGPGASATSLARPPEWPRGVDP